MRKPCMACAGSTSRTGKACPACGKLLPPTPRKLIKKYPKGKHAPKRPRKVPPAPPGDPHMFRRAH